MRPADLPRLPDGQGLPKAGTPADAEVLPSWDLSDLYESPESPRIAADLDRAMRDAKAFATTYRGKLAELEPVAIAGSLAEYERIEESLGRIMSYAQLLFSGDSSDAR